MEPYFDRFDICEAYLAYEQENHIGGALWVRPSNARRNEATHVQLERIGFSVGPLWNGWHSLSENGRAIYLNLARRYGQG